ncbi:MAG: hypothetical protein M5U28_03225 [Sandaracinaceae bacterium]|nr:hypothetical protein [Sandaracinaceae bacterium]
MRQTWIALALALSGCVLAPAPPEGWSEVVARPRTVVPVLVPDGGGVACPPPSLERPARSTCVGPACDWTFTDPVPPTDPCE